MANKYSKLLDELINDIKDEKLFIKQRDLVVLNETIEKINSKVVEHERIQD